MDLQEAVIRVVDCETTGMDPATSRVVEVAYADLNYRRGIIGSASSFINPGCKIPFDAMAIHHITDKMVEGAPRLDAVWPSFQNGSFHTMAAHNAPFDFSFLKAPPSVLCTLRLARHLWPDLESHKNQYLRYYLGVEVASDVLIHRALGDAIVTALVLQKMMGIVIEKGGIHDLETLIAWSNEPVLLGTCWFGNKHRGRKWSEVPLDYLQWMKEKVTDMDADTKYTVEQYLKQTKI